MLKFLYKTLFVTILSTSLLLLDFSHKELLINVNSTQAETLKTDAIDDSNMMASLVMTGVGLLAEKLYSAKKTTDIMLAAAGGAIFIAGDIMAVLKNRKTIKKLETEITRDEAGKIDQKQIETIEKLKQSYLAAKDAATTKKNLQMAAAAAFAAAGVSAFMMAATEQAMAAECMLGIKGALSASAEVLAVCQKHTAQAAEHTASATAHTAAADAAAAIPYCGGCAEAAKETAEATKETAEANKETAEAAACNKELKACTAKIGFDMTLLDSYESAREAPSASAAGLAADTANASTIITALPTSAASCSNYAKSMASIEAAGQCPSMAEVGNTQNSGGEPIVLSAQNDMDRILYPNQKFPLENSKTYLTSNYFEKLFNIAFPTAQAGLLDPLGIASDIAVQVVLMSSKSLSSALDLSLLIPKRRAIAWGVLSGLALAASTATGSELGKIQSNIDKIDAILNSMYALKNGLAVTSAPNVPNASANIDKAPLVDNKNLALNPVKNQEVDLKANGIGSLPCISGNDPAKCPSFSEQLNAQPDVKSLPDSVQVQVGNIGKLTDGMNSTSKISGSTLSEAQSLAGQSNALRAELLKQQKALQEKLKLSGSKTDLAKESSKLEADMRASVQKELDARKTTAGNMLASFGGGKSSFGSSSAIASDANKGAKEAKDAKDANNDAKEARKGGAGAITIPAATSTKLEEDADLNASLKDKNAEQLTGAESLKAAKNIDNYELKNDITQDKESSIFDLISNRYQKSGYPRLFKRVK